MALQIQASSSLAAAGARQQSTSRRSSSAVCSRPRHHGRSASSVRTPHHHARRSLTRTLATEVLEAPSQIPGLTDDSPPAAAAPQGSSTSSQLINWFQQWYPLAIVKDLEPDRPTAANLLGVPVVLWKDGSGAWNCFEDRCPHRLAPLSEGRIDADGTLMCSYHGWQFNSQGGCTRIPQIGDAKAEQVACQSKRSRVAAYPVKVHQGLLYVWPDASEGSAAAAAASPLPLIPELDQTDEWEPRTDWFMREVPISMETVVENVMDPCHANFTHHKVQGSRTNEKGTDIKPLTSPAPAGFKMEQDSGRFKATFEFQAPCFLKYDFPAFGRVMAVYVVPTSAGHCRMITRFIKNKKTFASRPGLMGLFLKVMEVVEGNRVLEHILMRNKVLDGDNYVLHVQERQLLAEGVTSWQQNYFMPGTSDTGVAAWRAWLQKYGAAMPVLPRRLADLPPLMSRRQALDRYEQHTKHCPDCQKALKRVDLALPATWAAAAAALLMAGVAAASGAPVLSLRVAGAAAAALALALAHRALVQFRKLFIFTDYVHADVD